MRIPTIIASALASTSLAGCGLANQGSTQHGTAQTAPPAVQPAQTAATPPAQSARNADTAIRRFAATFTNWKFATLAQTRQALAGQASGPLRDEMAKEAQQAANDAAVRASTASNVGVLQGVIDRAGQPSIVVVRETAKLDDGRAQQSGYQVYLVRAAKIGGTYKIVFWQPVSS